MRFDVKPIQGWCQIGCNEVTSQRKSVDFFRAKLYNKKRHAEKVQLKKTLKLHEEKKTKAKDSTKTPEGAVPAYLMDREGQTRAKLLSNMIKQKRKEKAVSDVYFLFCIIESTKGMQQRKSAHLLPMHSFSTS